MLFERSSRRVSLTGPGAAFLPEARAVLTRLAQAEQTARDLAVGRSGLVRMATTPGAPGLVRALLSHQRAAHPDVHVEIVATQGSSKLRAILDGDIDVALTHSAPATPGLAFTEVWREPWVPVVSAAHPLAGEKHVTLGALAAHPLVLVAGDGTSNMTEQFAAVCGRAGFEPTLGPSYANLGDALVEIARSAGWTMLRASNTRNVGDLGLVALPVHDDRATAVLWLAHRSDPAPAARSLLALAARLHGSGDLLPDADAGGPEE